MIQSAGIALVVKSLLGTSPISSLPYVLSLISPFTFGQTTFAVNMVFVVFELLMLRRDFPAVFWLQIPVTILFGFCIDFFMQLFAIVPEAYALKLLGGDAMCTNRLPELAGKQPLLKNIRCVQAGVPLEDLRDAAQWKQRYSKQFPKAAQLFSPYAYDATMVLAKAMMEADSAQPQAFLPYLRRVEYQGYTGKISFTAQGDLQEPVVTVYEYADGERKAVEPVAVAAPAAPLAPEAAKQKTAAGADK